MVLTPLRFRLVLGLLILAAVALFVLGLRLYGSGSVIMGGY